jgi:hypothetical protein
MAHPLSPAEQREALEQSEKRAADGQPENYKDAERDEKKVEIGPDKQDDPIRGLDPEDDRERR